MKNHRNIETLSAHLDGQLDSKESTKLESRLKTDPELESALRDLRAARGILRKLPSRKAPRNFTLTRQMVGLKPPLPRSYPLARFTTVFAAILFLCSFTTNTLTPMLNFGFGAGAPAPEAVMAGECEGCEGVAEQEAAATEAPATEEAFAAEMAPAATEEPPIVEMAPAATQAADLAPSSTITISPEILPTEGTEGARALEPTQALKEPAPEPTVEENAAETATQPGVEPEPRRPFNWTFLFLAVSILSGLAMWIMRLSARRKWR